MVRAWIAELFRNQSHPYRSEPDTALQYRHRPGQLYQVRPPRYPESPSDIGFKNPGTGARQSVQQVQRPRGTDRKWRSLSNVETRDASRGR